MFRTVNKISLILIGSMCSAAITACAPSYQNSAYGQGGYNQADYNQAGFYQGGFGFDQAGYGYGSDQSAYGYNQGAAYGYGAAQGFNYNQDSLRGSCGYAVQPCGMMRVVPVYPIYQIVTPAPAPVPTVEVVEVPTITLPEPEPIEIYEPAPVYEPVTNFWPEPETPVQTWAPLRK